MGGAPACVCRVFPGWYIRIAGFEGLAEILLRRLLLSDCTTCVHCVHCSVGRACIKHPMVLGGIGTAEVRGWIGCMAMQWMFILVLCGLLFQFGLAASGTGGI